MRMILLCCAHWFEHAGQPAQARFDGENSNFGTVTIEDNVYDELTETMTKVNALEALGAPQSGWPPAVRRMKVALTRGNFEDLGVSRRSSEIVAAAQRVEDRIERPTV